MRSLLDEAKEHIRSLQHLRLEGQQTNTHNSEKFCDFCGMETAADGCPDYCLDATKVQTPFLPPYNSFFWVKGTTKGASQEQKENKNIEQ